MEVDGLHQLFGYPNSSKLLYSAVERNAWFGTTSVNFWVNYTFKQEQFVPKGNLHLFSHPNTHTNKKCIAWK